MAEEKLWVPNQGTLSHEEKKFLIDEKEKLRKQKEKEVQDDKIPDLRPSDIEKINKVVKSVNNKYMGKSIQENTKGLISKEIKGRLEDIGFIASVEWQESLGVLLPSVIIKKRVEFDIDETAKLVHEVESRKGFVIKEKE